MIIITNLLTNMVVLLQATIPTNTPAFQEYVRNKLFAQAQELTVKWHLDQQAISTNNITEFTAKPYPGGPTARMVLNNRYVFGVFRGGSVGFSDSRFCKES